MANPALRSADHLRARRPSELAAAARRKFLRYFPHGFRDETYVARERDYKWQAHARWEEALGSCQFRALIRQRRFREIAMHAVSIESRYGPPPARACSPSR